jgi:hypothetical protein
MSPVGLKSPLRETAVRGDRSNAQLAIHGPPREITSAQVEEYLALVESVLYAMRQHIKSSKTSTACSA